MNDDQHNMNPLRTLRWVSPLIFGLGLLALIELTVRMLDVPRFLIPTPSSVAIELVSKWRIIGDNLLITMTEAILGFFIGNLIAVFFGFLFSHIRLLKQNIYPIIVGLQAVPLVAIAPFIIIWFGPGMGGKIAMAALICYFPATVLATNGFSNVNRDGKELLVSMGASRWRIFRSLALPSAVPGIVSALEVSATLCTIGAVVAELSGSNRGVGFLIVLASYEFRTTTLFAVLVATAVATIAFFKLVQFVGRRWAARYSISYVSI